MRAIKQLNFWTTSTVLILTALLCVVNGAGNDKKITLPLKPDSLRFAVIGDSGTGERMQYEVAKRLTEFRKSFPFDMVLMLGDNLYGRERPKDYEKKFERPYADLLKQGVKFYASLGNHDDSDQIHYKNFNMGGKRFYTFKPKDGIRFFALDSNYMDREQLQWLTVELKNSQSDWKICFFHHPLYSSGEKHGPSLELRKIIEPLFVENGVDVVFQGHEHLYERVKPQKGIYYFTSGAAAKLRPGGLEKNQPITAKGFDTDYHFLLAEIAGDELFFQTISRQGGTIDSGVVRRRD
jgi:predicted phosphodiesterase